MPAINLRAPDFSGLRARILATAYARMRGLEAMNEPATKGLQPMEAEALHAEVEAIAKLQATMKALLSIEEAT
jgi:hypothetical protein